MDGRPQVGLGVFVWREVENRGFFFRAAEKEILVGRRLAAEGDGTYGLPGGWLEHGESFADCAARELEEETGMQADIAGMKVFRVTNNVFPERHSVTIFMLATAAGEPQNLEPEKCSGWEWMKLSDLKAQRNVFLPLRMLLEAGLADSDLDPTKTIPL